jgi:hypothetical protein
MIPIDCVAMAFQCANVCLLLQDLEFLVQFSVLKLTDRGNLRCGAESGSFPQLTHKWATNYCPIRKPPKISFVLL